MYFDFFVTKDWEYLPSASVQTIYKLYTDPDYFIDHHIIDPKKYVFFYTMDGEGVIEVDGKGYSVDASGVFTANARLSLKYHCAGECWNFWLVEFKADRPLLPPDELHHLPFRPEYHTLLGDMLDNLKIGAPLMSTALFQVLCCSLAQRLSGTQRADDTTLFSRCILYMQTHLGQFSLAQFCTDIGISPRTINNLFRRTVGLPPYQYYQHLRSERSKEYLENAELSIAQIASSLGYTNSGHFSRIFKHAFGKTPLQYRTAFLLKL